MSHLITNLIKQPPWRLVTLFVADGLLFGGTSARNVASYVLIVGFLLLLATLYELSQAALAAANLYGLHLKRRRQLAASLAGLGGVVIALQSIGELSSRDLLVLLPLVIVGYLYSFYRYHQA